MKEIQTLPQSLQTQIQKAQNLLASSDRHEQEGYHSLAVSEARQGMNALVEIAQRSPELAVLVLGAMQGYGGIEFTTTERNTYYEKVEKLVFGIPVGTKYVPMTTTKTTTRTIRFTK